MVPLCLLKCWKIDEAPKLISQHFSGENKFLFLPCVLGVLSLFHNNDIEMNIFHVQHLVMNTNCVDSVRVEFLCKLNDFTRILTNLCIVRAIYASILGETR